MKDRKNIWCIAHRGARDEAPDNTRSAFEAALKYPVDGIELDVQMSADGVPVLFHDRTLHRAGLERKRVADLAFSQLQALDWGAWFHPDYAREPIMTLEQLLPMLDRCPRLMIEIKSHPREQADGHADRLTEKVVAELTRPGYGVWQDRLFILSFDARVLSLAHDLAPQFKKVLNLTGAEPRAPIGDTRHLWAIDVQIGRLNRQWVRWARGCNLRVLSYTCNTPRQVAKALKLDIDGIISDHPGWLTRHLGRG